MVFAYSCACSPETALDLFNETLFTAVSSDMAGSKGKRSRIAQPVLYLVFIRALMYGNE